VSVILFSGSACLAMAAEHDIRVGATQQDLSAGNSIVMNRGDIDEVLKGFQKCAPLLSNIVAVPSPQYVTPAGALISVC
jgi:hypothetical protein